MTEPHDCPLRNGEAEALLVHDTDGWTLWLAPGLPDGRADHLVEAAEHHAGGPVTILLAEPLPRLVESR